METSGEVTIRFGGPDRVSLRLLGNWPNGLLFAPGFETCGVNFVNFLSERLFGHGGLLFDEHSSFPSEFKSHCGRSEISYADIRTLVDYFTSRVRNYAHVETLAAAEFRHAVVRGECHDGEFVTVADAASWIKWFRKLTPARYAKHVYGRDFGFPPFNLECLCRMEGMFPGDEDYHVLNADRKLRRWIGRGIR